MLVRIVVAIVFYLLAFLRPGYNLVTTTPSGIVEATGSLATQTPTSSPPASSSGAASSLTFKDSNTLGSKLAIAGLTLFAGLLGGGLGALHL